MYIFIRLLLLQFIFMTSHAYSNEMVVETNNYVYCNVYLDSFCFGINRGDELNMQLPIDYLLYKVELSSGAEILIYYGGNPENITDKTIMLKKYKRDDVGFVALYQVDKSTFRMQYQYSKSDLIMDMIISNVNSNNYSSLNDFLKNFRTCKSINDNILCSNNRLFSRLEINKRGQIYFKPE